MPNDVSLIGFALIKSILFACAISPNLSFFHLAFILRLYFKNHDYQYSGLQIVFFLFEHEIGVIQQ